MNIDYSRDAIADLTAIHDYIARDNSVAASTITARIMQSIAMLADFPMAGRLGRVPHTRELPITRLPYFAVYRIGSETDLFILAIVHTSRQWPADGA